MARLPQATFALLLSLLPATATLIGILVLHQILDLLEIVGILLVASGVALHREAEAQPGEQARRKPLPKKRFPKQEGEAVSVHGEGRP